MPLHKGEWLEQTLRRDNREDDNGETEGAKGVNIATIQGMPLTTTH